MGHISFAYLDDGFGSQPDKCTAAAAAIIQKKELDSSGFLVNVNEKRCHWYPMQIGEWLGFVINSIAMTFQILDREGGIQTEDSFRLCNSR